MTEDFVPFELAVKLKEKGFREECFVRYYCSDKAYFERNSYHPDTESVFYCYNNDEDLGRFYIDAPTISQVLKSLRKEKNMYIEPCILADADTDADGKVINVYTYWSFCVTNIETGDMIYYEYEHIDDKRFDSYEEAATAGIEYVLDNLI